MKKWLLAAVLIVLALGGYIAAGPYLAYTAIRDAVETSDTAKLSRHVDFPQLRTNLKIQLDDYMIRRVGADVQSSPFGTFAVRMASGLAGAAVDTMVTPAGLSALLESRAVVHRVAGDTGTNTYQPAPPANPLRDPSYRFESTSRFSATVPGNEGQDIELVLTRHGLRWKLTDIRLSETAQDALLQP